MQIVYSRTAVPNLDGRKFQNPRNFTVPVEGATKVYVDGDWPVVRAAYEKAGVPVAPISEMRTLPGKAKADPVQQK